MKYPNRIQAALLLKARFNELDAVARDFARIAEMKSGAAFNIPEQHPGAFYRFFGGGDDLMLTFECIDTAPAKGVFDTALASPITTLLAPDMKAHVESARSHILLEVSHGPLSPAGASPIGAAILNDTGLAIDDGSAFNRRLEALVLMARVVIDHVTPSAIHWTQSNQLFEPEAFETAASGGFPGPLTIHPLLFGDEAKGVNPGAPGLVGVRTFGARHWLGREVVVSPTTLPWDAAYNTILSFCTSAAMAGNAPDGGIIPDGDTFGPAPDETGESGEIWRVHHRNEDPSTASNDDTSDKTNDGTNNDSTNNDGTNNDGDARGGPAPIYELIPLRHDACGFIAQEYAQRANVLSQRAPKIPDPAPAAIETGIEPAIETDDAAGEAGTSDPGSTLNELTAALAEGRAQAAANPPQQWPVTAQIGTPSLAGDIEVSGRSLRAKVFGKKDR